MWVSGITSVQLHSHSTGDTFEWLPDGGTLDMLVNIIESRRGRRRVLYASCCICPLPPRYRVPLFGTYMRSTSRRVAQLLLRLLACSPSSALSYPYGNLERVCRCYPPNSRETSPNLATSDSNSISTNINDDELVGWQRSRERFGRTSAV